MPVSLPAEVLYPAARRPLVLGELSCEPYCRAKGEWRGILVLGLGHAIEERRCPLCGRTETRWADAELARLEGGR